MAPMRKTLPLLMLLSLTMGAARPPAPAAALSKVIFDTDIGDDIDDAYALGFLLRSPEVKLLGVTTAFKDTHLRARLATRFLEAAGRTDVPVYEGPKTPGESNFTQQTWAEASPDRSYPDAIAFILDAIRKNPGEITLVSLAPLSNVRALIAKDPQTFRKLKRVVLMGGSVEHGYDTHKQPDAEWNIVNDIPGAQALFTSGVPLYVMPLDSTQIVLDPPHSAALSGKNTAMTKALDELTAEWRANSKRDLPVLFDVVAAVFTVAPETCPTTKMRIVVDQAGFTRKVDGLANAQVCLEASTTAFMDIFLGRTF